MKMHFNFRGLGVTVAAAVGAVAAGLFLGEMAVRELVVKMAQAHLEQYAARLVADDESLSAELRTALAAADASEHAACSAADIGYFRALIFESELVKDAGRWNQDGIRCSAALGAPHKPIEIGAPAFAQQDGTQIFMNVAAYRNHEPTTLLLARGNSYVVFTPQTRLHLEAVPMHFAITAMHAPTLKRGFLLGEDLSLSPKILAHEGIMRSGDHLYATLCSVRFFDCVTTWSTVDELIAANRNGYNAGIALSGAICGMVGFIFFSFYVNNKKLEKQLRRAIRAGRIGLAYQPIMELGTGRMAGAEALARWADDSQVNVPPDMFVRMAEEHGFIGELTKLVVHRVLRDFGEVLRYRNDFSVSINITAADLSDARFLPMLHKALASAKVEPARIAIEITESSTVRNQQAMETIRTLREQGHSVHIDDFGTGYSSLAYLHDLAVDAIKIDKVFTQAIGTESVTICILPQILSMAQALKLAVIVEGVETLEQAEYFIGADLPVFLQGYYFGKPQPFWQLLGLMAEGPRKFHLGLASGSRAKDVA
jgi:sensor c-di-GMP phosphodiesterase-like protein